MRRPTRRASLTVTALAMVVSCSRTAAQDQKFSPLEQGIIRSVTALDSTWVLDHVSSRTYEPSDPLKSPPTHYLLWSRRDEAIEIRYWVRASPEDAGREIERLRAMVIVRILSLPGADYDAT